VATDYLCNRVVTRIDVPTMIRTLKTERRIALGIFDGDLTFSESRASAFVTAKIVLIAFIAIPFARPFLLGAVGLGSILGITL
jgi:hypothetical protein